MFPDLPVISDKYKEREALHDLLGALLANIESQFFQNKDVYIDGYRFINCSFKDCRLVTNRGAFEFYNCRIDGGTILWNCEAIKAIQLFNFCAGAHKGTIFYPTVSEYGAISIHK